MSDEEVQVKFGADTGDFNAGSREVAGNLVDISAEVEHAEELFKYLGERMLEVFALHEIKDFVEKMSEVGEQIERVSAMTGLSNEMVQTLGFAMERTGGDAQGAGLMISRFERFVEEAATGTGRAYEAFQKLGISLQEIRTSSIDQLIERTAQGFKNMADPIERAAAASIIGGRGFAAMLPAILSSSEGFEAFHQRLVELNDDLSEKTVTALAETHEKITDLGRAAQGAGVQGMLTFKGAIDGVLEDFTYAIVDIGKVIGSFREFQTVLGADLVIACGLFVRAIQDLGAEAGYAADKLIIRWKEIGAVITEVTTLHWSSIADVQAEANAELEESAKKAVTAVASYQKEFDALKTSAIQAAGAILQADQATQKMAEGSPANRTGIGKADNASALSDIEKEQQVAKANLATQFAILQQEAAYHSITKQQEVEQEKQAADKTYAIDQQALEEKLALYQEGTADYEKTLNQMEVLDAQHTAKIAQLDVKMAEANAASQKQVQKQYQDTFNLIDRDLDSMLAGILQGTQSFNQAMDKLFANLAISFIEAVTKMILQWILFETITSGFGVLPWASPIANPFSGGALGSSLPSFDVGSWNVPGDMVATVHSGEMIIPAGQAQSIRDGSGSGLGSSINITFNVSAIDGANASAFIKSQAPAIAQVIATQVRNGNTNLMKAA